MFISSGGASSPPAGGHLFASASRWPNLGLRRDHFGAIAASRESGKPPSRLPTFGKYSQLGTNFDSPPTKLSAPSGGVQKTTPIFQTGHEIELNFLQ